MIGKTESFISAIIAVLVCIVHGYRTNDAELQKENSSEFADLKLAFSAFDKDESGHIDEEELKDVLAAIGHTPTESQLKEIMKMADKDGNGEISLSEFIEVAQNYADVDLSLKKTFKDVDTDNSGYITDDELHAWLSKLGKKLSEEEIAQLVEDVDENNDDQIHFHEFVELVKNLS